MITFSDFKFKMEALYLYNDEKINCNCIHIKQLINGL